MIASSGRVLKRGRRTVVSVRKSDLSAELRGEVQPIIIAATSTPTTTITITIIGEVTVVEAATLLALMVVAGGVAGVETDTERVAAQAVTRVTSTALVTAMVELSLAT